MWQSSLEQIPLSLGLPGTYSIHLNFPFQQLFFFKVCLFSVVLGNGTQTSGLSSGCTVYLAPGPCGPRV